MSVFERLKRWFASPATAASLPATATSAAASAAAAAAATTTTRPERSCALYARPDDDTIFVFTHGRNANNGWTVTHALAGSVGGAAGPDDVGRLVLQALDAFQVVPARDPDAARAAVPVAAGYQSWTALERGTRHISIDSDGSIVHVVPYVAMPEGGMRVVIRRPPRPPAQCPLEASAIGALVLETLQQMPPPPGVKPPRPPKSSTAADTVVSATASDDGGAADIPESFGYKMEWLAIATTDIRAVADALDLIDVTPCGWRDGVNAAHDDSNALFVTPAVAGWTLAVGFTPEGMLSAYLPRLQQLSARFAEVQYFGTHRVSEYHAWARAEGGRIVRAFEYGDGEIRTDVGPRTAEEEALGLRFAALADDPEGPSPGEEDVMVLAGEWSLNPQHLDAYQSRGPGLLGRQRPREK